MGQLKTSFNKMRMVCINKPYVLLPVILCVLLLTLFSDDDVIDSSLNAIGENSNYVSYTYKRGKKVYLSRGKLGDFYECLKGYKSMAHKKPNTSQGYNPINVYLNLDNKFLIDARVASEEAYFFSIRKTDEEGESIASSRAYSVNCELDLLDSNGY